MQSLEALRRAVMAGELRDGDEAVIPLSLALDIGRAERENWSYYLAALGCRLRVDWSTPGDEVVIRHRERARPVHRADELTAP
jgi:hypothetical protein